ncbi:MAG: LysR family transcriptional regulator [Acidobacteriota bacterium]|nr:LysR family transcriptional regulator [Acidobacteriota bacterium]
MEIHQLGYFCAVVKTGSFTKAAELEGVSQPTLSQQIRRLEQSLGAELFTRQGRAVRLTHAGNSLYPFAQEILHQSKQAAAQVRQLATDIRGPLRVGVIPTILPYLIAPHLPEFLSKFPDIEILLTEDVTERLVDHLQACDLDLIVVSLPLHHRDIVCSGLMRDPLVLVTPKNHRLAGPLEQRHLDLFGERLLLLKDGHCFRDDMLTACKHSRSEMSPVFESDHFGTIFPLVASGAGVTIAPMMAARYAKDCSVVALPKPQYRQIGYARLKSSGSFKPLSAFTKWLHSLSKSLTADSHS